MHGQTFSLTGQIVNVLGFAGHTVTIAQLCYYPVKAVMHNAVIIKCNCVPIKLYL